jgi:hypothetical protein
VSHHGWKFYLQIWTPLFEVIQHELCMEKILVKRSERSNMTSDSSNRENDLANDVADVTKQ